MGFSLENSDVNIELELKSIALEAGVIDNLVDRLGKVLPRLTSLLVDISSVFTTDVDVKQYKELKSLYILSNKIPKDKTLESISLKLVKIPPNFKGNLLQYLMFVKALNTDLYTDLNKYLDEFTVMLNGIINNESDRKTIINDNKQFIAINKILKNYIKEFDEYRSHDVKTDKYPLGKVIDSINEVKLLIKSSVDLSENLKQQDPNIIKSKVDEVIDKLKIINKAIKNKEYEVISGSVTKDLAEGTYALASYVEFYSLLRFTDEQIFESVIDIVNTVLKK